MSSGSPSPACCDGPARPGRSRSRAPSPTSGGRAPKWPTRSRSPSISRWSGCPRASSCGARPHALARLVQPLPRTGRRRSRRRRGRAVRTSPARGRDLPALRGRHRRPRAAHPRRAPAGAARGAAVPTRLPGPVPELRRRPQPHELRLHAPASPTPVGRRCARSISDPSISISSRSHEELRNDGRPEAQDEPLRDPLAQVGKHAACAPGTLAVPELRRVAASSPGVRQLWLVPRPPGPRRRVAGNDPCRP